MNGLEIADEAEPVDWDTKIAEANRITAIGSPSGQAVTDRWNAIREAANISGKQIEEMARALQGAYEDALGAEPATPITYTNRAARRARARAERKSA